MHSARPTVVQPYAVSTQRLRAVSFQTDCGATRTSTRSFYSYWEKAPRLCYRTLKLQAKPQLALYHPPVPRGAEGADYLSPVSAVGAFCAIMGTPAALGVSSVGDRPQALP